MSNDALIARASEALSMEPDEILSVAETDEGLVAVTLDNNALVINEDLDPPVQFLVPPMAGYKGSFPVLHPDRDPLPEPPDVIADEEPIRDEPLDTPPAADPEPHPVPDTVDLTASVSEILDAVGDDHDLAEHILAIEQAADKPRKTLVGGLEALLAGDGD